VFFSTRHEKNGDPAISTNNPNKKREGLQGLVKKNLSTGREKARIP